VLRAYQDRKLFDRWMAENEGVVALPGLSPEETALLKFLDRRLVPRS
jgi:hypothetical protein